MTTFGVVIEPDAPMPELVERARIAERLGFDTIYVPDHARPWRSDPRPGGVWFDGWTVIAAMAMATITARVGSMVANPVLRPPNLVIREALSVDHLSGGRLQLGIGTGIAPFDHHATGTPYWTMPERVARFREYVEVVDMAMRSAGEPFGHDGEFHRCDLVGLPAPVQNPRPPGAAAGRDPASVRRSVLLHESLDPWSAPRGSRHFAAESGRPGRRVAVSPGVVGRWSCLLGVHGGALELHDHAGFVADDPAVVAGGDPVHASWDDLSGGSVVVPDAEGARHDVSDVLHLARLGADDGPDALGPPPARLEGEAADLTFADFDDLDGRPFGASDAAASGVGLIFAVALWVVRFLRRRRSP